MATDFHRSRRDQNAVGIAGDDALQSVEDAFRAGLGPSVSPWSNAAMKDRPLSRSKSWPRRISAPFTIESLQGRGNLGPPRRTIKRSPCLGLTPPVGYDFADHRPAVHERQYPINRRPVAFGPLLGMPARCRTTRLPWRERETPRASGDRACRSRAPSGAVRCVVTATAGGSPFPGSATSSSLPRLAACPVRLL